ncbi:proline-rich transmembrane protein 1-like [Littorina saxatilis]|uniref:Proline-rich transmembrane protein 1 n=1 Tax=Littorina saxatilis TaxID=31220 RepID=A0AAN9B4X1_9CAEN
MDGKEAPPSYNEVIGSETAPPPPSYNIAIGYPPSQGDQGATQWAYPTNTGYPQGYGNTVYGNQAGYVPAQPGYPAGCGPVGQGAGQEGFSRGVQQPSYVLQQQGYHPGQHTVVVNQTIDRGTGAVNTMPDSMVLAVFTTLCCCWPVGLLAVMKAQECRQELQAGNVAAARTASNESRRYSKFAIVAGICWINFCITMMTIYLIVFT